MKISKLPNILGKTIRNPRLHLSIRSLFQVGCSTSQHIAFSCGCKIPPYSQQKAKVGELSAILETQKEAREDASLQLQTLYAGQIVQAGGSLHYKKKGENSDDPLVNPSLISPTGVRLGYLSANLNPSYYDQIKIDTSGLCDSDPRQVLSDKEGLESELIQERARLRQAQINDLHKYTCFLECKDSLPQEVSDYFKSFELSDFSNQSVDRFFSTMVTTNQKIMNYDPANTYKLIGCERVMKGFLLALSQSPEYSQEFIAFCEDNKIPFEQRETSKDHYYRTFDDATQKHFELLQGYFSQTMNQVTVQEAIHRSNNAQKLMTQELKRDSYKPLWGAYNNFVNYAKGPIKIELGNPKTGNAIKDFDLGERNCPPTLSVNFCGPASQAFGGPISKDATLSRTYILTNTTDIAQINHDLQGLYEHILTTYPQETGALMLLNVTNREGEILANKKVDIVR